MPGIICISSIDVAATGKINNTDLHLFISMAKILGYNHYPSGVHTWEYDAAINFIAGLLKSVADGANSEINSGFIHLQTPFLPSVHIDTFDAQFARLCEEICKNYSYDD